MRYTPESRARWRKWLQQNHASQTEVWLVFLKKHTGKQNLTYDDAVEEAICFGWIDGIRRSIDEDRYMHRFSPRRPNSRWSASNRKRARKMLDSDRMAPAGMTTIEQAKKNGHWERAASPPAGFDMPPAFSARLKRSKKAAAFFSTLSPSYQKQYIAWIATAKRPETRKRRLDEAMERLKRGQKLGMR